MEKRVSMTTSQPARSELRQSDEKNLPFIEGEVFYCKKILGNATLDVLHPNNTYIPLEGHTVKIRDARPIRGELDLDKQGFVLIDHKSALSHLRDVQALDEPYHKEHLGIIADLSGADLVLPHLALYVRFAAKIGAPGSNETMLPAVYLHLDYSEKSFLETVEFVLAKAGMAGKKYRRAAMFQTWRAVSEPPQDFPLTLTDGRSPKPGNTVILDSIIGPPDITGNIVETLLGTWSETDEWYYFSNMRESELLVFKGFDTAYGHTQNVLHTSFDARAAQKNSKPRESIEARFIALWE